MSIDGSTGPLQPVATRPRSAKAALLVILGEFVWPADAPVWSSTLVRALGVLGIEAEAARKAVRRTAEAGVIVSRRAGRQVQWSVTPRGGALMRAGHNRVMRWQERATAWDGQWLVVWVSVPEERRSLRHQLGTRLRAIGLGSPGFGQWLTPKSERAAEVADVIRDLGLESGAQMFVGRPGPIADEGTMIAGAWDVASLSQQYGAFIEEWSQLRRPETDRECFAVRVELTQDWRYFPFADPDLPPRFLPSDWPGPRASEVFLERYADVATSSERYWQHLSS